MRIKISMGIRAKRQFISRIIGFSVILIGIIISIVFDFFILDPLSFIYSFLPLLILLLFILSLKFEVQFIRENYTISAIIMITGVIIFCIMGLIQSFIEPIHIVYLLNTSSNILIVISWHYSLTIYKKKKLITIGGYILYSFLTVSLRLYTFNTLIGLFLSLLPFILRSCGQVIILITEIRMKKK